MPLNWYGDMIMVQARAAAMRGVVRGTESIRNEMIRLIQSPPKTGRIYRRRGVEHQASAPGQAPATDTGRLVNSIVTRYEPSELTGIVGVTAAYGDDLEFGTQKMEPRPYARPAVRNKIRGIEADIANELKQVFPT